jgi:membrane-anchored protein YejM (alkaline phosphatase superfamily)
MPNNLVLIVMDSCRYDSFVEARTPNLDLIGATQRRFSYASWTSPSHCVLLMGIMPHQSPTGTFASEVYKTEFAEWIHRLAVERVSFKTFVPHLSLPKVLHELGYWTVGRVSLPVLNEFTPFSSYFDDYRLMDNHNDFAGMVRDARFSGDRPVFYFFNLGETHYPYMLTDMPKISGVHGVFKREAGGPGQDEREARGFFDQAEMQRLHHRQVQCVEYVDTLVGELLKKAPANTYFVVTADHGELFGEDGFFGHGPIMHPKCFEVPFLEGRHPVNQELAASRTM